MISIITSLYRSERHLSLFLRRARHISEKLNVLGIAHEFLMLPNDPSETEMKMLEDAASLLPAIRIIKRARESIYATWNEGVRNAKFNMVTPWNVDDARFAAGFAEISRKLDPEKAMILYSPFIYVRFIRILFMKLPAKVKRFIPPLFESKRFQREMHAGPFFAATKRCFDEIGFFDESFRISGDYDWMSRAAGCPAIEFVRGEKTSGIFTNDGTTISGSKNAKQAEENRRVIENIKP